MHLVWFFRTPTTPRYVSNPIRCHTLGQGAIFGRRKKIVLHRSGPTSLITLMFGTPPVSIADSNNDVPSLILLASLRCALTDISTVFDHSVFCWSSWREGTGLHRWRVTRGVVFPFIHDGRIMSRGWPAQKTKKINPKSEQQLGTVFYV